MNDYVDSDQNGMMLALEQAKLAVKAGEVPIGSILVSDRSVVAVGETRVARSGPVAHGENTMLQGLGNSLWSIKRPLVLYTNVEPCLMCYGACIEAGVDRIVYGIPAPMDGGLWAATGVIERGRATPEVSGGVLGDACMQLIHDYLKNSGDSPGAVYVRTLTNELVDETE
jgi:tRNA(adenine34) deaminase